jgi:hypothetical protein
LCDMIQHDTAQHVARPLSGACYNRAASCNTVQHVATQCRSLTGALHTWHTVLQHTHDGTPATKHASATAHLLPPVAPPAAAAADEPVVVRRYRRGRRLVGVVPVPAEVVYVLQHGNDTLQRGTNTLQHGGLVPAISRFVRVCGCVRARARA